jgi:hypothetical protein
MDVLWLAFIIRSADIQQKGFQLLPGQFAASDSPVAPASSGAGLPAEPGHEPARGRTEWGTAAGTGGCGTDGTGGTGGTAGLALLNFPCLFP